MYQTANLKLKIPQDVDACDTPEYFKDGFEKIDAHTHDDRYYTEAEIDTKLDSKTTINTLMEVGTPHFPTHGHRYDAFVQIVNTDIFKLKVASGHKTSVDYADEAGFAKNKKYTFSGKGTARLSDLIAQNVAVGEYMGSFVASNCIDLPENQAGWGYQGFYFTGEYTIILINRTSSPNIYVKTI